MQWRPKMMRRKKAARCPAASGVRKRRTRGQSGDHARHAGGVPQPRSASEPRGCARGLALAAKARAARVRASASAGARAAAPPACCSPSVGSQWVPMGPMGMERGAPRSKTMRSAARSSLCRPSRNVRRYLPHANQPPAGHAARGCGRRLCSRRSCVCRAMPRLAAVARLPMPLAHAERISRHGGETH